MIEDFYLGIFKKCRKKSKKAKKKYFCKFSIQYLNLEYNKIPISMALDNNYLYPTIVAITSIVENSNPRTKLLFNIMHPSDFNEQNKEKIKNLERKYNRIEINLINMKEEYKNAFISRKITTPTYYRLSLSELLPNVDKILWIDGDTLTFNDLKEMYDIDMKNFHYKGFLDSSSNAVDFFTEENDHCICAGVMIVNLKELRKDNMGNKFISFISEFQNQLSYHDQTVINALSYKKIDILPPKFGIFNINSVSNWNKILKKFRYKYKYSKEELYEALSDPVILHCIIKPWLKKKNNNFNFRMDYYDSKWWYYAKKTDFYNEILSKYIKKI